MKKAKILYGVCGIGMGHTYRQLPILHHLAADEQQNRIVLFCYGESLAFYSRHFADKVNVTIVPVSVPFYVGNKQGLDFEETARRIADDKEAGIDHDAINLAAMAKAQRVFESFDDAKGGSGSKRSTKSGAKPDLVISDYCPVSAQYAYAHNAPLVTIDQQSKYLVGDYTEELGGTTCLDEVARLRLFFPRAERRIACSFFQVERSPNATEKVTFLPPIIKPAVIELKKLRRKMQKSNSVLVYISSQREFVQPLEEVIDVLAKVPEFRFTVFVKELPQPFAENLPANVKLRRHGDPRFLDHLAECRGLISTGGHSLVSEVMYLGIPAYLIPLAVYEQQMNSHVVGRNGFGVCAEDVNLAELRCFLGNLDGYAENIRKDRKVLVRGSGEERILKLLNRQFLAGR